MGPDCSKHYKNCEYEINLLGQQPSVNQAYF